MRTSTTLARRSSLLCLVALLLGMVSAAVLATNAQAVNIANTWGTMHWTGRLYVYVEAGETLTLTMGPRNVPYAGLRPDGTPFAFTLTPGTTQPAPCRPQGGGTKCSFSEVATQTGVWVIDSGATSTSLGADYEQTITVTDGGVEQHGRAWLEQFGSEQTTSGVTNASMYLVSQYGTQYQLSLLGLAGYFSDWSFNNKGIMYADSCESTYFSVPSPNPQQPEAPGALDPSDYTLDGSNCPDFAFYRTFLEPPDPSMPASTSLWADGRTANTWVMPTYTTADLTTPTYARDSAASWAGTISTTLTGQPGQVVAGIDVNGDGDLDDDEDVVFDPTPAAVGPVAVDWDGLDGNGDPVPVTQDVTVYVSLAATDELHLAFRDMEGLNGGVEVTRLNGPGAPSKALSWDDTFLAPRANDIPPPVLEATAANSTGGVHSWQRSGAGVLGWGDSRAIDSWAFSETDTEASATITGLENDLSIVKTTTSAAEISPGAAVPFKVTVTNSGTADYTADNSVRVFDAVVTGGGAVDSVTSIIASTGTTTTADPRNLAWLIDDLPVGDSATLTYTMKISASADPGNLVNWAFVGGLGVPQECTADSVCSAVELAVAQGSPGPPSPSPRPTPAPSSADGSGTGLGATGADSLVLAGMGAFTLMVGAALLVIRAQRAKA